MAKSIHQKLKLLYLIDILREETDEDHPLNAQELIERLEGKGITAERKSIYDDMAELEYYGYDIVLSKSKINGGYYLASTEFELPELKLLVDSVSASRFITRKKSEKLIEKLKKLCNKHDRAQLQRQVYVQNRIKTDNEGIYYNVDTIYSAIYQNKKIIFHYYAWSADKEKTLRNEGKEYRVSPLGFSWNDDNYYLVAYAEEKEEIRHYRVDKMKDITISDEARSEKSGYRDFDIAEYGKQIFGMYGGEPESVTLRFPKHLAGVLLDRFGRDITIRKEDNEYSSVRITVAVSNQFFGWLAGIGPDMKITSPQRVKNNYIEYLKQIINSE